MRQFSWSGNFVVWFAIEAGAMWLTAWGLLCLVGIGGAEIVGRSIASATILLSVAVAVVIQLWVKLNELSAIATLEDKERRKLRGIVQPRARALVWLVVFFVAFVFFMLTATIISGSGSQLAGPILSGVGAGCGASLVLIACVLIDLNEIADYRWEVELRDMEKRRREEVVSSLDDDGPGFDGDEHLQGYKRVINDR